MQPLAEFCIKRPVFATMLILAVVVAGGVSFFGLGIDRFPQMDLPVVFVNVIYPGAAAEEVESEIAQVLEDAVATVAGIEELRSISSEGSAMLLITFGLTRNIDSATQDVRDAVSSVMNRLPQGALAPIIRKQDLDSSPILSLAVSAPRDRRDLYLLADRFVKNVIESAHGVGEVSIRGSTDRALQVRIQADRLTAYGISISQVRAAIQRQNAEVPGGRVESPKAELGLRTIGRLENVRDFANLVVDTRGGTPIHLGDIAEIVDHQKENRGLARLNGVPAVVLEVQRQAETNTIAVIEAVKQRLERSRELLPDDVSVEVIRDQSRYIEAAIHEIEQHLVIGSLLATLVVLFFMNSWRSTIIAAVAIPTSIIGTFAVMGALGFTLNNVTMLALVLMVGVVIDDAIVVLENIYHFVEEKGMGSFQAAIEGTREIGPAVLSTTISLVIVFLPVSFLSSVAGRMLFQFGVTATASLLISMLVSFTLTPMMCSRMLKPSSAGHAGPASRRGFYHLIDLVYTFCLKYSLKARWLVLLVCLAVVASNVPLAGIVQRDYVPTNVDESEFEIRVSAPEGTSLVSMNQALEAIESELKEVTGIETVLSTVGGRGGGGFGVNSASIYVRIEDFSKRTISLRRMLQELWKSDISKAFEGNYTQQEKMAEIRERVKKFPDLRCSIRNQTSLRTGAPVDIDFAILGQGLPRLAAVAEDLRNRIATIPGIVDVDTTLRLNKPQLLARIDRDRAALLKVDVREIADTLGLAVGGDDRASRYRDLSFDDAYDVEIRLQGIDRESSDSISQLYVRTGNLPPSATRIDNLVTFTKGMSPARIDRLDRQQVVFVRANVSPGFGLGSRLDAINQAVEEMGLPLGFSTRVVGSGRELDRTFEDFRWTFLLSFVFMYIVLAAQYEHLVHPLTILFSLPIAVPFGMISLWLGGETLNLYSALGILVLFGVVKKASILQIDHTNVLRRRGLPRDQAIMQANRDRLRPILMTTIAFVAGMLPMLTGSGPGAEERRSIAVLAVGGQSLSLLLTLVAVPVLYAILDDLAGIFRSRTKEQSQSSDQPQ